MNTAEQLGYFGWAVRFLLLIINFLFFIIGLVMFITACILKWGTVFTDLIKIDGIDDLLHSSSISAVAVVLMIVSGFIMALSMIGYLGVKRLSRPLMIAYEVTVCIMLLTHVVSVLVVVFGWPTLEKEFRTGFSQVIDKINSNTTSPKEQTDSCALSYDLSGFFKCCGALGPDDFVNQTLVQICCKPFKNGCNDAVTHKLKEIVDNLLVTPSIILIVIEVFAAFATPFFIRVARKRSEYTRWN